MCNMWSVCSCCCVKHEGVSESTCRCCQRHSLYVLNTFQLLNTLVNVFLCKPNVSCELFVHNYFLCKTTLKQVWLKKMFVPDVRKPDSLLETLLSQIAFSCNSPQSMFLFHFDDGFIVLIRRCSNTQKGVGSSSSSTSLSLNFDVQNYMPEQSKETTEESRRYLANAGSLLHLESFFTQ